MDEGRSRGGGGQGERRGRGDEERGPAAERQPHAEQRAAAPPNSLAALGSDYSEDAAPEPDEHAAAPTDDAGAQRYQQTVGPPLTSPLRARLSFLFCSWKSFLV